MQLTLDRRSRCHLVHLLMPHDGNTASVLHEGGVSAVFGTIIAEEGSSIRAKGGRQRL
jgi:hypothetical protein